MGGCTSCRGGAEVVHQRCRGGAEWCRDAVVQRCSGAEVLSGCTGLAEVVVQMQSRCTEVQWWCRGGVEEVLVV